MFDRLRSLWSSLSGAKIFMTGGTGFFGVWLVEALLDANRRLDLGIELYLLTRDPARWSKKFTHLADDAAVKLIHGDVRSVADSSSGQLPKKLDCIIHAAFDSCVVPTTLTPRSILDSVLTGAMQVLRIAEITKVKRLLYVSSGAAYGQQPQNISHLQEDFKGSFDLGLSLKSAYSEGKRAGELLAISHASDHAYHTVIARGFTFVGPYLPLDAHFAIGNFLRNILEGKEVIVNGDGTPVRSYLYAADMAIWLWTILLKGHAGHAYNVGSPEAISVSNLANVIAELEYPHKKVIICKVPSKDHTLDQYVPDVTKANADLGLRVFVPLDEALRRTLRFHRL